MAKKRRYFPRMPKPGRMTAYYGFFREYGRTEGPDLIYARGDGVSKRCGHLLNYYFAPLHRDHEGKRIPPLHKALEEAGFDLSTLRFSIEMKAPHSAGGGSAP